MHINTFPGVGGGALTSVPHETSQLFNVLFHNLNFPPGNPIVKEPGHQTSICIRGLPVHQERKSLYWTNDLNICINIYHSSCLHIGSLIITPVHEVVAIVLLVTSNAILDTSIKWLWIKQSIISKRASPLVYSTALVSLTGHGFDSWVSSRTKKPVYGTTNP